MEDRLKRGDRQGLPEAAGSGEEEPVAFLTDKGMQVGRLVHVHVTPRRRFPTEPFAVMMGSSCLLMTQGALVAKNALFRVSVLVSHPDGGFPIALTLEPGDVR